MKTITQAFAIALIILTTLAPAGASTLKDYKKQKHGDRQDVSRKDCPAEYTATCTAKCTQGDEACAKKCEAEAKPFCEDRTSRQKLKAAELWAKGFSLGAGGYGMLFDDAMPTVTVDPNGESLISPYAIIWNASSYDGELGFGLIEAGAMAVMGKAHARWGWFGLHAQGTYFWDEGETLTEADLGPTFYFATANIQVALTPSLIISAGNGVDNEYGVGVRTDNMFILGQGFILFNPMLYYLNDQWGYQLRVGYGYRFTPRFFATLNYDFRDILDLKDLDVSQSALQGAFLTLGYRFN